MKTFKRKTFYTAVLAALGAMGAVGTANAVHVNADGLGQALIYPYYTVRNADAGTFNTYLSVVNTTNSTKAVKVRFLEGKNSKEVLDFNLYLSPYDVWTAAVVPVSGTNAALGAKMVTADRSCTTPTFLGNEAAFVFKNYAYIKADGSSLDGETNALDRTNEGYFEIIEMGDITAASITTGVKHVSGVPANCGVLTTANLQIAGTVIAGTGGLAGTATLINVNNGVDYGYNPVVLDAFADVSIWNPPGDILPNLANVTPKFSDVFNGSVGVVTTDWTASANLADPVSAVLMHDNIINEFVLDTATASGTDWVITFPTKWAYVRNDQLVSGVRQNTPAIRPFQRNFWTGGACDDISITMNDREEASAPSIVIPSPPPPTLQSSVLCWEANVLSFVNGAGATSNNLGSINLSTVPYKYQNGWTNVGFLRGITGYLQAHQLEAPVASTTVNGVQQGAGNATYYGLPSVGFMVQDFANGALVIGTTPTLSNYGGNFDHKNTRSIITN